MARRADYSNNQDKKDYLTTGVGGAGLSFEYWCATKDGELNGWFFYSHFWDSKFSNYRSNKLRPVLGF